MRIRMAFFNVIRIRNTDLNFVFVKSLRNKEISKLPKSRQEILEQILI